jgi:L-ascorbate metabolism protein UlaG (beta-lactamase superfamily)
MKATYYGHSCVRLQGPNFDILFDPFIRPNGLAQHINVEEIKPQHIFLSHAHEDHVADMAYIQQNSGAQVVAIVETAAWVARQGVPADKITEMNFGGTLKTDWGTAKMVYALHTNGTPDGQYGGVPVGYVLTIAGKKIYFAGDTALTQEMKLLEHVDLDWAFLPIGGHYTMDVDDAIRAAEFVDCHNIIGIHYNTFPPISLDKTEAKKKFDDAGLNLHLPEIGETVQLYNLW